MAVANTMSARGCWGRYQSNHSYEYDTSNGSVSSVTVTARPTIELPRWDGYSRASREEKREWDRMLGCLTRHENNHHARFVDKWTRFKRDLSRARSMTERDLQRAWSRFDSDVNGAQQAYDRSSRNGQNEGVRLDAPGS